MRLILSGGGSGAQVKESYEIFARELGGKKVLYVPIAWNHGNIENCINWFTSEMKPFGVTNIEQALTAQEITKEKLAGVGGVFIGGGNTFSLLKNLKESGAFANLKEFLERGGIVMGGSAGALIFGKSIETCLKSKENIASTDENLVELSDFSGFDAVNGYSLFCHYMKKEEESELTKQSVQNLVKAGHKLICLPEETSVYVNGDKITIIGQKPAEVFDGANSKTIKPNGRI